MPEVLNQSAHTVLPLMEEFYTIQGEGFYQGQAAYFIRLGGCDVGCVWCDVKESWDASAYPVVAVAEIADKAAATGAPVAVITGGEPLMYDLAQLTASLKDAGLRTHLETSGVYPVTGTWDWICWSPKKFKSPHPALAGLANELKVIVYNKSDFEWAETFAAQVNDACELFLQPEWSREKEMLPPIIEYVKLHPQWKISLQIHKYMNVP
ncbi:MAG TPA: 7-carboxy-7-deazaguanine synthase QueE [Chryseosolibacter sp.]|nr:7-carboxy-7-deazaguanine synthase QueE [Chryseosolibacter sp.]